MEPRHYILDGHAVIATADVLRWAVWFETADRTVATTTVTPTVEVSTVFLGRDHQVGSGPPLLFETMIFGLPDDDELCWRYTTWAQAEEGHQAAVRHAQAVLSPSVCPPGSLCERCLDAPATDLVPAPWGGEMGVCRGCARHEGAPAQEDGSDGGDGSRVEGRGGTATGASPS
jgi:hypothetical protein